MFKERAAYSVAAVLCLLLATAGCSTHATATSGNAHAQRTAAGSPANTGSDINALAADYLAIALPANHRLDTEVDGYTDHEHDNLAAAESALRAEAATERRFDRLLIKIPFPPRIAATARALVRANQSRAELTMRQARSSSIPALLSFTTRHKAADAAVEAQVRIIRRDLGLPPPETS